MQQAGQQILESFLAWNSELLIAFETMKREIQTVPSQFRLCETVPLACQQSGWLCISGINAIDL